MLRRVLILAALVLGCGVSVSAQGFRIGDAQPVSSSLTSTSPITPLQASVNVCVNPANAVPCTNKASTFTSVTLATPCSAATQVVLAGTTTCVTQTDSRGNWGAWVAAGNYDITFTLATGQSFGPYTISVGIPVGTNISPGNLTVTGAQTVGTFNGTCYIDGLSTNRTTIAAALSDATCSTVDDTGFKSGGTIAATITWPSRSVTLKLAAASTYNGPASGSVFVINSFLSNGSAIIGGSAVTANQQANYGNGTVIKAAPSNTSPLIQIVSGVAVQVLQGFRLENLVLDDNNPGTTGTPTSNDVLLLDAVRNSRFTNLSFNNCTGYMIHATATNTSANQGTQYNRFDGIFGGGCNGVAFLDGNSTATSSTTLNTFTHIAANFTCGSCAGIEIRQGDGNDFLSIENLFPTNTFTGQCVQVDSPAAGVEGGLFNYFYKYHVSCAQGSTGGDSFRAKANSKGNEIYAFDAIENQANPVVELSANFSYHISKSNLTEFYGLSVFEYLAWLNGNGAGNQAFDVGMGRCGAGILAVGNGSTSCDRSGELDASVLSSGSATFATETTAPSGTAGKDVCYGDSTAHALKCSYNNGPFSQIPISPNLLVSTTAPTIAAAGCGGAAAAIVSPNGTAAFKVNVGTTPGSACTFTMPTATTGWNVTCNDITTQSTAVFVQKQTGAESQTSVTITNFNDVAVATAFVASDILKCTASAD